MDFLECEIIFWCSVGMLVKCDAKESALQKRFFSYRQVLHAPNFICADSNTLFLHKYFLVELSQENE